MEAGLNWNVRLAWVFPPPLPTLFHISSLPIWHSKLPMLALRM